MANRHAVQWGRSSAGRSRILRKALTTAAALALVLTTGAMPTVAANSPRCHVAAPTIHQGTITNADRLEAAKRAAADRAACSSPSTVRPNALPLGTPDYFGTTPNYANSPLPTDTADVAFTGGGGTGAAATATVENGAITEIAVTNSGSGYTSAPSVVLSGGHGAGAVATATILGVVASISVTNGGHGYLAAPVVTINGDGIGATATAVVTGPITAVARTAGGGGYTTPAVAITGSGGTGASATAQGQVDAIVVAAGGTGYVAPTAVFSGGGGAGAAANVVTDVSGVVTGLTITNPGSGYTSAPSVAINDASGTGASAQATLTITGLTLSAGGSGYTSNPTLTITDSTGTGTGATGTATLTADVVSSITVVNHGTSYGSATVSIGGPGTGATATATINGGVSAVTVLNGGAGFATGGIRKFVDALPGLGDGAANDLGQYLPVAVPDTTTYPGSDYYEIAVIQYRQKLSTDLPATLLRGYVQSETPVNAASSKHIALTNALLNGSTTPAQCPRRPGLRLRRTPVPRPDDRRRAERPDPRQVHQLPAHRRRRRPVPAGRHHGHGRGRGPWIQTAIHAIPRCNPTAPPTHRTGRHSTCTAA